MILIVLVYSMNKNIRDYLRYDEITGDFTWIKKSSPNTIVGEKAGSVSTQGYGVISFNKIHYKEHRLAWFFHYWKWPDNYIDHINGKRRDNRIVNLRDVSRRENCANKEMHREGKLVGCYFQKSSKKWISKIFFKKTQIYIGLFPTEKSAHDAYLKKYSELFASS